ncbi:serine threonine- kinase Nek1 isoform X5 [Chlorella sorokiniana]|uniref:Rab3 GTPase-activating protein catalytic subunit n=1 Tax=Chlorella sorokiniana TaxID=3076 RepID=A0A2P6TY13_CHLSO|nr:serine threonine- kinase Nek1 isoform X5 [Chlorella sorokiniana]|eukprot:PRW58940.1 serine threonine- kinase Nek1 isoform X5 [Chlorella sorokiniana]
MLRLTAAQPAVGAGRCVDGALFAPLQRPRARRRHHVCTVAQATGRAAQKKEKQSLGASILSSVLSLSSAPYSSYVPEPKTFLHHASAEVKQLWTVAVLLLMARASTPVRLAIVAVLALSTVASLPRRLWEPQLLRLGGLCGVLFFFTLIGAEGVPPVLSDRAVPAATAGAAAAAATAASSGAAAAATAAGSAAAAELPASMAALGAPNYRYVLFHFGWITVTKRSLNLAVALTSLTFAALQSASLCLVTTPPEAMATAVGRALRPLGLLGVPVRELVLTVLLALRFMAMVFEECRALCMGLAARGIDWRQQGLRGTVGICVSIAAKLFTNLMARCDNIAVAMAARGFQGPDTHALRDGAPPAPPAALVEPSSRSLSGEARDVLKPLPSINGRGSQHRSSQSGGTSGRSSHTGEALPMLLLAGAGKASGRTLGNWPSRTLGSLTAWQMLAADIQREMETAATAGGGGSARASQLSDGGRLSRCSPRDRTSQASVDANLVMASDAAEVPLPGELSGQRRSSANAAAADLPAHGSAASSSGGTVPASDGSFSGEALGSRLERDYDVVGELGRGAFGSALKARRRANGCLVCLKALDWQSMGASERRMTRDEVRVLRSLAHPNVIQYQDCFTDGGMQYIVMEYAEEGDLEKMLKARGGELLPEGQLMMKFVQLCLGLQHVHAKGIIHRDIKSSNLLVGRHGMLKLGDFGIAKIMAPGKSHAKTMVGTPYYFAPELVEDKPYSKKADVWAAGCVLYELATLQRPFRGSSVSAIAVKILSMPYVRLHMKRYRDYVAREVEHRKQSYFQSLDGYDLDSLSGSTAAGTLALGVAAAKLLRQRSQHGAAAGVTFNRQAAALASLAAAAPQQQQQQQQLSPLELPGLVLPTKVRRASSNPGSPASMTAWGLKAAPEPMAGGSESSFIDFTVASAFERLAADIEACLTTWRSGKELRRALSRHVQQHEQGSSTEVLLVRRAQLRHRLPFRSEPYTLTLHLPPQQRQAGAEAEPRSPRHRAADAALVAPVAGGPVEGAAPPAAADAAPVAAAPELGDAPHRLQTWFGLGAFLLLTPDSYSGRVLETEEEHTLLSAAAVALSHAGCPWPLLLPVHDAVRDGYRGVAVVQPSAGPQAAAAALVGQTVKFDTDSLHSSRLPVGLLQLDQLILLFAKQLAAAGDEQDGSSAWGEEAGSGGKGEWDEHAPWRPWSAQADPVGCLELDVVWRFPSAAAALQSAAAAGELLGEEAASASLAPQQAAEWRLLALSDSYERDTGHRGFVLRPVDKQRRFLRLQSLLGRRTQRVLSGAADVPPAALPGDASFYSMLLQLLESCRYAARAPALGSLASADWWPQQGAYLPPAPPEWVLREALRDIFQLPVLPVWPGSASASVAWPVGTDGQHGRLGKAAPQGALISRFTLHALALGSPRAVAELWSRFVSALRLTYWEQLQPLPRMRLGQQQQGQQKRASNSNKANGKMLGSNGGGSGSSPGGGSGSYPGGDRPEAPNLELCLLHQKLQLLDLCIHLQAQRQQAQQEAGQRDARQQGRQGSAAALDWEASWGSEEEGEQQGQQGSQAALEWEASWGDGDSSSGREQQPHSPASSSSSYLSARAGSEASLSPVGERPRPQRQRLQQAAPDQPRSNGDAAAGELAAAEARGAVGVLPGATLHLHPGRPLWIPAVQESPVHTEDTLAESQAALQSLPAAEQSAAALRSQLQGRLLSSDMQAFKAANPGACLLDFVRWHSPKDCRQGEGSALELSGRMAAKGNVWQQLWDAAKPVPAAQQRLLFDTRLEGERVLHFLETLPPPALFAELLAVGFSAAVQLLLVAGPAAALPAVRRQLECLVAAAGPELQQGVAAVLSGEDRGGSAAAPAPAEEQEAGGGSAGASASASPEASPSGKPKAGGSSGMLPQRQPSWVRTILGSGLSSDAFRRLLLLLGAAEQTAVAAHSLLLRLDQQQPAQQGRQEESDEEEESDDDDSEAEEDEEEEQEQQKQQQQQQQQQQPNASRSWVPSPCAVHAADGLIAAALGEVQPMPGAAAVRLPAASWAEAEALLTQRTEWETDGSLSASSAGSSAGEEGWPDPFQREWLLTCSSSGVEPESGAAAPAAAAAVKAGEAHPPPRKPSSPGGSGSGWPAPWEAGIAAGHRLYARALPSEVRIATAVAPEALSGRTAVVEAAPGDTVADLKHKLAQVKILTNHLPCGQEVTIDLEPSATKAEIRSKLEAVTGVPAEHQKVMLSGINQIVMGDKRTNIGYAYCGSTNGVTMAVNTK